MLLSPTLNFCGLANITEAKSTSTVSEEQWKNNL